MKKPRTNSTNFREALSRLARDIESCERCPRLRRHCAAIAHEKRASFRKDSYWGRPVPNFDTSDITALLIVGLAPAAHGANRTGRMFTGDRSGQWLYRALHRAGFANQATYERADDSLELMNCSITAVAHCAPPENKPSPAEIANCSGYLDRTLALHRPRVIVALGAIAWRAVFELKRAHGFAAKRVPPFAHGAEARFSDDLVMIGSYHPSQQNTFTKRLTEPMFDAIFERARRLLPSDANQAVRG